MKRRASRGFTLVEVVLALGIASFAILSLVALLPAGAASTKSSVDETNATNILSRIVADRKATPFSQASKFYNLPILKAGMATTAQTVALLSDGTVSPTATGRYLLTYTFTVPTGTSDPYIGDFILSWPIRPAGNTLPPEGSVENVATFPQP